MKKRHLFTMALIVISLLSFSQNTAAAQSISTTPEVLFTPLKPKDGSPVVFSSRQELEQKKPLKINGIKDEIRVNQNNPEIIKHLREQIWRFENAIVIEPKN